MGGAKHRGVVVGIARGHHPESEVAKGLGGAALAVVDPQPVAADPAAGLDFELVTEKRRPAELAHEWGRKLLKGIREDDHLCPRSQPVKELSRALEWAHAGDHLLDQGQGDAVLIEDGETLSHQHIVIGFVPRRAAEFGNPGPLGHVDPNFRDENTFEVKARDHGPTLAEALWSDKRSQAGRAWGPQGRTLLAVVAVLAAVTFAGCAAPLRVGTSGDYPPFSVVGKTGPAGFEIEAARAYAAARGRTVQWVPFRWPELEHDLLAGRFDVAMSGVTVRPERLARSSMTLASSRTEAGLYLRRGTGAPAGHDEGLRLAVNRGGHLERLARLRLPAAALRPIDDNRGLPHLLLSGEVDAIIADDAEAQSFPPGLVRVRVLGSDRKAWWVAPGREGLAADLDDWLRSTSGAARLIDLRRQFNLVSPTVSDMAIRPVDDFVIDLIARRLALMPLVAAAKRRAAQVGSPPARHDATARGADVTVRVAQREAEVRAQGRRRSRQACLDQQAYARLVEVQMGVARDLQQRMLEKPSTLAMQGAGFSLEAELRPAIDRIDTQLARALSAAVPLRTSPVALRQALIAETQALALQPAGLDQIVGALLLLRRAEGCRSVRPGDAARMRGTRRR